MTFKKGDKLICTQPKSSDSSEFDLPAETVLTVEVDTPPRASVRLVGHTKWYDRDRFRLAGIGEVATSDRLTAPALTTQVGGGHYKDCAIQPVEFIHANGLTFIEGCVVKYVSRWRKKGGIQDLKKARHFLDMLIELEGKATPAAA